MYLFLSQSTLMNSKNVKIFGSYLEVAIFSFSTGLGFSIVIDYHFDFENLRYKKLYCLGPLNIGTWRNFKKLEYISVFKNNNDVFKINLWYNVNKHFTISINDEKKPALAMGKLLSEKLNIDLLDATNPRNSHWV